MCCWMIRRIQDVEDYIKLTLYSGTENIVIPVDVLPVVGEVTLLDT